MRTLPLAMAGLLALLGAACSQQNQAESAAPVTTPLQPAANGPAGVGGIPPSINGVRTFGPRSQGGA